MIARKVIFSSLFTLSIGLNIYFIIFSEYKDDEMKRDRVHLGQASLKRSVDETLEIARNIELPINSKTQQLKSVSKKQTLNQLALESNDQDTDSLGTDNQEASEEQLAQMNYEKAKKRWRVESEEFFVNELNFSSSMLESYRELARDREEELNEYFSPKILQAKEEAKIKNSKVTYYIHNTEDRMFLAMVSKKYEDMLQASLSEDDFVKYQDFLKDYNLKIAEEGSFYPVDF